MTNYPRCNVYQRKAYRGSLAINTKLQISANFRGRNGTIIIKEDYSFLCCCWYSRAWMIVFIGVVSILGRQREERLRETKGSSWLVVSWQGAVVAASTKSIVFLALSMLVAVLHNSTQCRKVWPQGSFHILVNAPSSRRIGDSKSRPPDLKLGALTKCGC